MRSRVDALDGLAIEVVNSSTSKICQFRLRCGPELIERTLVKPHNQSQRL